MTRHQEKDERMGGGNGGGVWKEGEEREKKHGTKTDRKQEKETFLLGDAKFIKTMRTNCGVGSVTEGL